MGKSSILLLSVYCRSNSEQQSCTDVNIKAEPYNFPHLPCCDGESCFGRLCTSWWCKSATGNMKIGAASVSLRMLILHVKRRARCKMCEFQLLTFSFEQTLPYLFERYLDTFPTFFSIFIFTTIVYNVFYQFVSVVLVRKRQIKPLCFTLILFSKCRCWLMLTVPWINKTNKQQSNDKI